MSIISSSIQTLNLVYKFVIRQGCLIVNPMPTIFYYGFCLNYRFEIRLQCIIAHYFALNTVALKLLLLVTEWHTDITISTHNVNMAFTTKVPR
ncbi:hypothetical protein VTH8203_03598 [Vibrio thalassae]|uniref:Uncharacterized protein n=1 Tax=Vibrio thalassae TaxID=1243014 RepID=A0A240EPR0_9VIBR|nr:hypothetical protein VTH8203_03598 [Vibrio thalassae]